MKTKKRDPIISVLFPVKGSRPYLDFALRSIKNQTLGNVEVLIEEDTGEGITSLLIRLVKKAKGKFLARMDADDIAEPHRLERQVNYLNSNPETQLVGSWAKLIDENGKYIGERQTPVTWEEIKKEIFFHNPLIHPTWMMRRSWYEKVGGYDPRYRFSQDWELLLRTVWASRVENIPEPLLKYRVHKQSVSFSSNKSQLFHGLKAQIATLARGDVSVWKSIYLFPKLGSFIIPSSIKYFLSRG